MKHLRWALVLLGSLVVGGVFVVAGVMKALDVDGFSKDIALHGILGPTFSAILARVLVPFEIVVGTAVILGYRRRLGLALLVVTLVVFTGATGWAWWHGNTEGCGCFGRFAARTPGTVIFEDLVLIVVGVVAWLAARMPRPASAGAPSGAAFSRPFLKAPAETTVPSAAATSSPASPGPGSARASSAISSASLGLPKWRARWRPVLIAALTVAATAFTLASPYLPIDDYATALRPGVSLQDLGLAQIAGDLAEGERLLVILDLDQEATLRAVASLNALSERPGVPPITGLTSADEKKRAEFFWTAAPNFQILEAPAADLRRLYRRAPRSFRVHNGAVLQVWDGIPPAEDLAP